MKCMHNKGYGIWIFSPVDLPLPRFRLNAKCLRFSKAGWGFYDIELFEKSVTVP